MSADMVANDDEHAVADESAADTRIAQMVDDPAGYFARSRQEAKREARHYVAKRLRTAKPA